MYTIKCNNLGNEKLLMDVRDEELIIQSAEIKEDLNKVPSLTFSIPQKNLNYQEIKKLISEIYVNDMDSENEIFRGRCMSEDMDFYNTKTVTCEGTLAYLLDTKYPPYVHTGSVAEFLKDLLDYHNSRATERQKVYLGNVTVVDPNDYIRRESQDYTEVYNIIQDKLVSSLGGWIRLRRVNGKNYLDYLAEYAESDQIMRFGENILDLTQHAKAETIKTVIIPLGAEDEETGERVNITTVNNGVNYIKDDDLVAAYGWIEDVVMWDDVTEPENLLKKAKEYLENCRNMEITIEISAVDARAYGMDVKRLIPGMTVDVISEPHGLNDKFLCSSKTTNLLDPSQDKVTLGRSIDTFTETIQRQQIEISKKIGQTGNNLKDRINKASGLYKTEVPQEDGSTITYYHDKKKLNDSMIRMVFNTAGFSISADGGEHWYGMTVNGEFISKILETTGIIADWIIAGMLKSKDFDKNVKGVAFDLDKGVIESYSTSGESTYKAYFSEGSVQVERSTKNGNTSMVVITANMIRALEGGCEFSVGNVTDNTKGIFITDSNTNESLQLGPDAVIYTKDGTRYSGKSGRAEFSDGSYLDFRRGFLVGGKTESGTSF